MKYTKYIWNHFFLSVQYCAWQLVPSFRANCVLPAHIEIGHCTVLPILISYLIMFHIWPHLAYSCSLQILSPGTGDQNGCQTYLTLAKLWATDKRGRLFALPLASLHPWRCSRPAWQCPGWHTQHAAGWKFTVPCHSSYANFAPNKLWLGSVSKHVNTKIKRLLCATVHTLWKKPVLWLIMHLRTYPMKMFWRMRTPHPLMAPAASIFPNANTRELFLGFSIML